MVNGNKKMMMMMIMMMMIMTTNKKGKKRKIKSFGDRYSIFLARKRRDLNFPWWSLSSFL
jgi:hypothetical protein